MDVAQGQQRGGPVLQQQDPLGSLVCSLTLSLRACCIDVPQEAGDRVGVELPQACDGTSSRQGLYSSKVR